jgi:hypothetical protein
MYEKQQLFEFMLNRIVDVKAAHMYSHAWLTVFALVVRSSEAVNVAWGKPEFTTFLDSKSHRWDKLVLAAIDHVRAFYRQESTRYKKREGQPLPYNTYFKSQSSISRIFKASLPRELRSLARKTFAAE